MPSASTYAAWRSTVANKTILSGKYGTSWQVVMGQAQDVEIQRQIWARRARMPSWCPSDGLTYLGAERMLEQVTLYGSLQKEDETLYRARLQQAWVIWQKAGSAQVHTDAEYWAGLVGVTVNRRAEWSNPPNTNLPSPYVGAFQRLVWAQFDLYIPQPNPWTVKKWGSGTWGAPATWGSTMTVVEVEQIKRLTRTFRAAHDTPMWCCVSFTGKVWGNGTWGSGVWGGSGFRFLIGEPDWHARGLA